jgi:hypothetical protein
VNAPPPSKLPPICRLPPAIRDPVEKLKLPRPPVIRPIPFRPLTAISSDPVRLIPADDPERTPPLFVKSTESLANAAIDRAITSSAIKTIRFITVFLLNLFEPF